jgi:hypothetical protein
MCILTDAAKNGKPALEKTGCAKKEGFWCGGWICTLETQERKTEASSTRVKKAALLRRRDRT